MKLWLAGFAEGHSTRRTAMRNSFEKIKSSLVSFSRKEDGVTAIEYALIASLVALAIIVGATALGTDIGNLFSSIGTKV
jgi:pilus assembly protein Flp/PilA